jgi:putative ABC transport system substrate-binding protein
VAAFRRGLEKSGFVERRNVVIDFRWAAGQNSRLPAMATELIAKQVAVIVALSSTPAAVAAKDSTSVIPIFFLIADPPIELGLVKSFNRPGGNATGLITLAVELAPKRLELLHELAPQATTLAALINPAHPSAKTVSDRLQETARALKVPLQIFEATTDNEIEIAYRTLKPGSALLVATDPSFFVRRAKLVSLAAQHTVPAIYDNADSVQSGGLVSYGANIETLWEQAGMSVGRILKGETPANLPVAQPTTFELMINRTTARTLGLEIPPRVLASADDVID